MKKQPMPVFGTAEGNSLEKQALSQLNAGKYKKAIELYKKLLQDSDNSEWRQQLAHCYLQYASALAAKGLYQEARASWENYSQHTQPPYEKYDHYLTWLIQTNNPARVQSCLAQLSARQLDKDYPELAAWLGLLIITDHSEFQQSLPQNSDFIAHLTSVQTALRAYQDNNLSGMDEALKQLPYRSAFRDFRTLLKAAVAVSAAPQEAQALLTKIPAHSPYAQAADLLLASTRKGSALAREIVKFNHQQRRLIGEIIGLDEKQLEFIEQLGNQKEVWSDKLKFDLAVQYQTLCGFELAQRFCLAMLARYPAGQQDVNNAFGPVDEFEQNRLKALACEREDNSYDAEYHWRQCIRALTKEGSGNTLKTALILRHLAENQPDAEEKIPLLIESLEHNPDDRASYLQILGYYSQFPDTADTFKQWLSKAFAQFPRDADVLTLALQAAMRDRAHANVSEYAQTLLTIDPLNTAAKQALFASHLAHARKLIQGREYPAAENEIQQAEGLKLGKSYGLQIQLMRGLLCFASQDKQQGLQAITEAQNKLNTDPVNMHFQAAMEALLTNLPVATLLRELPPAKDYLLSAQELARLVERLKRYSQESGSQEQTHKALEKIKAALKKSLQQQDYAENLLLALCEALDSIRHFELLRYCSKLAQSKWQKPVWIYFQIYSETDGEPERCSFMNRLRLEENLEKARQEKDHRATVLIDHYLDGYHKAHPLKAMNFLDNLFAKDEQNNVENPFDKLFGHLSYETFHKLNKKLTSLSKKTSPERLVQELNRANGDKILQAIMKNPDLFTALMVLRAADALGIAIEVSVEEILACFNVSKKSGFSLFNLGKSL
ncbi:hypothetical protein [Methylobacter luteus]|uniref:hypothetical protein n=1 Tax=Methylobacter luteus TaxID=415 RepID=UPI0012DC2520|nr:hypothetical protein [Methylobacter luteus]